MVRRPARRTHVVRACRSGSRRLAAGLELEPGTSPPVLRRIPGWRPVAGARRPRAGARRTCGWSDAYLRLCGPSTPAAAATFLEMPPARGQGALAGRRGADRGGRARGAWRCPDVPEPAETAGLVRLLGPFDLWLQARDRDLVVPDRSRHKALWPTIGRPGAVLVGVELVGTWRPKASGQQLTRHRRRLAAGRPAGPRTGRRAGRTARRAPRGRAAGAALGLARGLGSECVRRRCRSHAGEPRWRTRADPGPGSGARAGEARSRAGTPTRARRASIQRGARCLSPDHELQRAPRAHRHAPRPTGLQAPLGGDLALWRTDREDHQVGLRVRHEPLDRRHRTGFVEHAHRWPVLDEGGGGHLLLERLDQPAAPARPRPPGGPRSGVRSSRAAVRSLPGTRDSRRPDSLASRASTRLSQRTSQASAYALAKAAPDGLSGAWSRRTTWSTFGVTT